MTLGLGLIALAIGYGAYIISDSLDRLASTIKIATIVTNDRTPTVME